MKDSKQHRNTENDSLQGNSGFKKHLEILRQLLQELKQHNSSFNKSCFIIQQNVPVKKAVFTFSASAKLSSIILVFICSGSEELLADLLGFFSQLFIHPPGEN